MSNIDWSQMVTAEMKAAQAAEKYLESVQAELAGYRKIADEAIAPLQDAVELGRADDAKVTKLKEWKIYRLDLLDVPAQEGYPTTITWPAPPA